MKRSTADIVREYGPFPDVGQVGGVSYDGTNIWVAAGDTMKAVDPERGTIARSLNVPAHAGTAFDGKYLFQISGNRIQKVDPESGHVISSIPTPEGGASGMAWAEGSLWVGQNRSRKIHQVDPESGKILRTIDFEPLRDRRHLGWQGTLARNLGRREKRSPPSRSSIGRSAGADRDAARRWRIGP